MTRNIPIGLQFFSVREEYARDLPASLAGIAKMGYQGVKLYRANNHPAKEWRKLRDDNGLKCCGSHLTLESLQGDALAASIEFNQTVGNQFLIVAWLAAERHNTPAACAQTARIFAEIGEKLKPHDMYAGFHTHNCDFNKFEDGQLLSTFCAGKAGRALSCNSIPPTCSPAAPNRLIICGVTPARR